jgi:hypothetical protein
VCTCSIEVTRATPRCQLRISAETSVVRPSQGRSGRNSQLFFPVYRKSHTPIQKFWQSSASPPVDRALALQPVILTVHSACEPKVVGRSRARAVENVMCSQCSKLQPQGVDLRDAIVRATSCLQPRSSREPRGDAVLSRRGHALQHDTKPSSPGGNSLC